MSVFPCSYFTVSTRYPESGIRINLGRSYQFDVPPEAPDQRIFTVTVQGLTWFTNADGTVNRTTNPGRNIAVLEDFYRDRRRALAFTFNHPAEGAIQVKFNRPLEIPSPISGGSGVLPDVEVELIEVP